jgi:hypothetical protein
MPAFKVTAPDGTAYNVTAPDGATEADVMAQVQAHHAAPQPQAQAPPLTQPSSGLLARSFLPQAIPELRSYQPSPRDWLQGQITNLFGGGRDASRDADKVMGLLNLTPVGGLLTAYDSGQVFGGGLLQSNPAQIARGIGGVGLAGLLALPAAGLSESVFGGLGEGAENAASRNILLYNPPAKPPRPFAADYPSGAPADAQGNLTQDIEGNPLTARWVVGRTSVGAPDRPFPAPTLSELDALAEAGTGQLPKKIAPGDLRGAYGRVTLNALGDPTGIFLSNNLTPVQETRVLGHENAHIIDQLAGEIDTTGLNRELNQVYSTLATGQERTRNLTRPQDFGYSGDEIPREKIAEAIRAYLTDPNYLKTVAPKTAAAIRNAVNTNPRVSKIIQFNGIAAPLAGGLIPQQSDPDN